MNTLHGPENFTDMRSMTDALAETDLRPAACRAKAECFAQAVSALPEKGTVPSNKRGQSPLPATATAGRGFPIGFFVPGRIEVLGKHTDYGGGSSLVTATERGFCLVVAPREDRVVRMTNAGWGETIEFLLTPDLIPPVGSWINYPMTVARRLCRNFPSLSTGAEIAFFSDLPPASGMSSSSALMVATFLALAEVNRLSEQPEYPAELNDPLRLAEYLGTVENGQSYGSLTGDRGVGTFGGSEDHTAMLCAEAGRLSRFVYCPTRREGTFPFPAGHLFAIGSSGVVSEKTGEAMEKYNRASRLVSRMVEIWRSETGESVSHLKAILEKSPQAAERLRQMIAKLPKAEAADLQVRLDHFLAENEKIIPAACEALQKGDLAEFGRQVDASQDATEHLLKNQVPETVFLAKSARELGATSASAFGAGFGGSVWALVKESQAQPFLADWAKVYRAKFSEPAVRSEFFLTAAAPAAFRISRE
jgi:galactokinase